MHSSHSFNEDILIPDNIKQNVKDSFFIYFLLVTSMLDWIMIVCVSELCTFFILNIWFIFFTVGFVCILDFPEYIVPEPEMIRLSYCHPWRAENFLTENCIDMELGMLALHL